MSTSTTLRGLMGLPAEPASFATSALIMIDCQNTYRQGIMALSGVEPAIVEATLLLARARDARIPVVHIMHDAGPGSPYDVTAEIGQISDEVRPRDGEAVIVKNYPSSFFQTDLDQRLRESGAKNLVLAGFMTHMCVNSTARDAFNLGYQPTIVSAATATRDLPTPDGPVPAEAVQRSSLAGLADLFALIVSRTQDLPD